MGFSRKNALMQALDIAGSFTQNQNLNINEESLGFGSVVAGQNGNSASITTNFFGILTITGLTNMSTNSIGRMLTISGAANINNNGTFVIVNYLSPSSVNISNINGSSNDLNNGTISWTERSAYSLEDDINYIRTDRKLIKGTSNWYDPIPVYERPDAIGTSIEANLKNISGKTTDALSYTINKSYFGANVSAGNTKITITSSGNFKQSDFVDTTGIPCYDVGPFASDLVSCYVHVIDGYKSGTELTVLSGPHAGERIFGVTQQGSSLSPNSIEIKFYSSPFFSDYNLTNNPYTWESGQTNLINLIYGFNERLDQLDNNAFRSVPTLGVLTDGTLNNEIKNILLTTGTSSGDTNLSGLLSNTSSYYSFYNLPDATPSVIDALNTLNYQIGDRNYTGIVLTSGETISSSLQALANAIGSANIIRTIERVSSDIISNTAHTLPAGLSYTLDSTNNGKNLWIFTRGILRDPGPISAGNDYEETSSTSVTFYQTINKDDHINYFLIST